MSSTPGRDRVSNAQMIKLLELMSRDGVLVDGRVDSRIKVTFWKGIASELNAIEGCQKPSWKWSKMWSDWKANTKKKMLKLIEKKPDCSVESLAKKELNTLENDLLKLIGYPKRLPTETSLFPKSEPQESAILSSNDKKVDELAAPVEYFVEDYQAVDSENSQFYHEDNINIEEEQSSDYISELSHESDVEAHVKKEPVDKKIKRILPNRKKLFKGKPQFNLEREKVLQKREELRLKAVELKLRGDELRIKEKEINKVNSLMNIEEEKLKCFKEISASLNELLQRTNSANNDAFGIVNV